MPEAALVELGNQRTLQLVAFVDEGEPESKADIVEYLRVFGPGDHRPRAHYGRNVTVHECIAGKVGDPNHFRDDIAAFGAAVMLGLGQYDFDLVIVRQIIKRGDD